MIQMLFARLPQLKDDYDEISSETVTNDPSSSKHLIERTTLDQVRNYNSREIEFQQDIN
jgi:hypothetical protein